MKRNADALFSEQQFGDFSPRLAALPQLADKIKVWFQDAAEWFAAAFSLCRFCHLRAEYHGFGKQRQGAGES